MQTKSDIDDLKHRIPLSSVIGRAVKLRRMGDDLFAPCPFHLEKTASFSVNDAKGFFYCFGCHVQGDVFKWFQLTEKLSFLQAVERVRQEAGQFVARSQPAGDSRGAEKQALARQIWASCLPISGTPAETYLRAVRRVTIPLPATLRFHPELAFSRRHALGLPAMVAAVTDSARRVVAIQRTFLQPDGMGKAKIEIPKKSLGPIGLGAVRLAPAGETLGLAEGIETALSAQELYRLPVWAMLGSNLSRADLPEPVRTVVLFADRGQAGEQAAARARETFLKQRCKVSVCFPEIGKDFNDELKSRRGA
ncbi:DNA primase [Azospirillaceae bacterium]